MSAVLAETSLREAEAKVRKDEPLLLLCRSGKRSALAAKAAAKAGFEGELDAAQRRGAGWRFSGLPWVQD